MRLVSADVRRTWTPSTWTTPYYSTLWGYYGYGWGNVEEVRSAVTAFKDRYNRYWRLEKLGFRSPYEARQAYAMQKAA